jgi:ribosome-associated protein
MKTVFITQEPVELFKLLKFEGLVGSGGEAKFVVSQGLVKLNGEVERQKRKKVLAGDIVEFNDQLMSIVLQAST